MGTEGEAGQSERTLGELCEVVGCFRLNPKCICSVIVYLPDALGPVTVTKLNFPHHFNECHGCSARRNVGRIK